MALTREDVDIIRSIIGDEVRKVREDVQKLSERVGELNYKFDEYREWTDLRFSTLREAISTRPAGGRRRNPWPRYGPAGDGCNSTHIVRYSKSTI